MSEEPLKLLSSMAGRELIAELVAAYQRTSGERVTALAAGGVDVVKRVQAGEALDIVVLADTVIDRLIGEGKLRAGSRIDLVRSAVAVAVRTGAPKPDIRTAEALRAAVLAAKSVGYSSGPSGVYLEKLFQRWQILDAIRERCVIAPPGVPVASLIVKGQVELGFQQLSELMHVAGVELVGPLPPEIQLVTIFSGGIGQHSQRTAAARALLEYMAAPAATPVKQRFGMDAA